MQSCNAPENAPEIVVTGVGVTASIGQGQDEFLQTLLGGGHRFSVMGRPGRQYDVPASGNAGDGRVSSNFLGAEIPSLSVPNFVPNSLLRTASLSGQVALATVHEAWRDANLAQVDSARIGLIVGGSNFQQRELLLTREAYRERPEFLRPTCGMNFMDSDVCGMCTQVFGIRGLAYTLGAASASGAMAIIGAIQAVASGQVDVCIALGALMDLSYWECQGFRSLGAMGSDRFAEQPALACRPFDRDSDGFIFGESCGVVVVESAAAIDRKGVAPYARVRGWSVKLDGNRNPDPSLEGEIAAIQGALHMAGVHSKDIDYVNPHGTGSALGDKTELNALAQCGLREAYLNTTKSVIGHGLSAAGTVETIATLLQMRAQQLHPCRNLDRPVDAGFNLVLSDSRPATIKRALKMSMGFGGVNTALCLERP